MERRTALNSVKFTGVQLKNVPDGISRSLIPITYEGEKDEVRRDRVQSRN